MPRASSRSTQASCLSLRMRPFALRTALSAGFHGIGVSEAHHDQKTLRQLSEIYIDEQMSADAFIHALHERKLI